MAIPGMSTTATRAPRAPRKPKFQPTGAYGTSTARGKPDLAWFAGVLDGVSGILNIRPPVPESFKDRPTELALARASYESLHRLAQKGDAHADQTPWEPLSFALEAPGGFDVMGREDGVGFRPLNVPGNYVRATEADAPAANPAQDVKSLRLMGFDDDEIVKTLSEAGVKNADAYVLQD